MIDADRFWSLVDTSGGPDACWPWTRSVTTDGYGRFFCRGEGERRSHRLAWTLTNHAPIPRDKQVCHACDNPRCCNPKHLWIGTMLDNNRDKAAKGRAHRGNKHHNTHLTEDVIREIRRLGNSRAPWTHGDLSLVALGRRFGINHSTVARILRRQTWKHVA